MIYRYILEPLPDAEFEKKRSKVAHCPCGKSNKDGKFAPYVGFEDRGHCHSCGVTFQAAHMCPECHQPNSFSRYIDTENADAYLADVVGKCLACTYHHTPKEYLVTGEQEQASPVKPKPKPIPAPARNITPAASYVPTDVFKGSLQAYQANHFTGFLQHLFGPDLTALLIARYFIGTSKHWPGATVFYQIDSEGGIRSGKIMLYHADTGKRVKDPVKGAGFVTWLHSALKLKDYQLSQCFFGEHLLKTEPRKPVGIVESEKTAIIASAYLPEFVWLATGGKGMLKEQKCHVLKGREVVLYPDLNAHEEWSRLASELSSVTSFTVSELLNSKAGEAERIAGLDLADYLIALNAEGIKPETKAQQQEEEPEFYHCTFEELTAILGHERAARKAEHYQQLSDRFQACKTYVLHTSNLLTTYRQSLNN
ncbi:DUF6371 domain-containing protein [Pontibacter virosus]|uniref:Toprim domain-containing protein n=1 Tax=Pontibacter virosus TaxID=1765052 RepID=A0A2U1B3J6_9BACT|nr:DUF6371 domain-containing protein [Pontibacter virosus]PVY43264.1 hypothetical protein C8E01_102443 [Pontibacter virosus]